MSLQLIWNAFVGTCKAPFILLLAISVFVWLDSILLLFAVYITIAISIFSENDKRETLLWCWAALHWFAVLVLMKLEAGALFDNVLYKERPYFTLVLYVQIMAAFTVGLYHLPWGLKLFANWCPRAADFSTVEIQTSQQLVYAISLPAVIVIWNMIVQVCTRLRNIWQNRGTSEDEAVSKKVVSTNLQESKSNPQVVKVNRSSGHVVHTEIKRCADQKQKLDKDN